MPERLSAEDARILALEQGPIVAHTCKVLVAPSPGGDAVERLRRHVAERIDSTPELLRRLDLSEPSRPAWVEDPTFDIARHVRPASADGPVERPGFRQVVAELMSQRLRRDRPLWRIDVVPLADGHVGVVWRIHHALADGMAVVALGSRLLWEGGSERPARRSDGSVPAGARWRGALRSIEHAPSTVGRELRPHAGRSPFDVTIGRKRRVAFVPLPLEELHQAGKSVDPAATLNDVVLALVAGALRRWRAARGEEPLPLRVQVPVSMHRPSDEPYAMGNRDSFINVDLPLDIADPHDRLVTVSRETRLRKEQQDAGELYSLFGQLAHVGAAYRAVNRWISNPHVFALAVSNVPGPAGRPTLAGEPVEEAYSLAEIAPRHALRVSVLSFGDLLAFGLCADAGAVADLDEIAEAIEVEAAALADAV